MTAKEAYEILIRDYPESKVIKCYEYESVIVFQVVRNNFSSRNNPDDILNALVSVDKNTKKTSGFNPMSISLNEYRGGKEIKDFR